MSTTIIAIDPGLHGALAIYCPTTRRLFLHDTPVTANPKGKAIIDLRALYSLLEPEPGRTIAVVEDVSVRPGEGAVGAFSFGRGIGAIDMACTAHGLEMRRVTPSVWKRHFGLIFPKGTESKLVKSASRTLAAERFPANAKEFARVKDDGRAEAALIALYGAEVLLK